jgi:hypothetical protein
VKSAKKNSANTIQLGFAIVENPLDIRPGLPLQKIANRSTLSIDIKSREQTPPWKVTWAATAWHEPRTSIGADLTQRAPVQRNGHASSSRIFGTEKVARRLLAKIK